MVDLDGSGDVCDLETTLFARVHGAADGFGTAVARSGLRVAVGAPEDGGGVVHLFRREASGWVRETQLRLERLTAPWGRPIEALGPSGWQTKED